MIKVHSLAYSRAVRIVWLLEELGHPYEVALYDRTENYAAPDSLRAIHPLGKSPIIEDGDFVLGESAAILRYIDDRIGGGRFSPAPGTREAARHDEWLDYVEGSLARPVAAAFWVKRNGGEMDAKSRGLLDLHMAYLDAHLAERPALMGEAITLADIQLLYLLAMARYSGVLTAGHVGAYYDRLLEIPALQRAIAATGPIMPDA